MNNIKATLITIASVFVILAGAAYLAFNIDANNTAPPTEKAVAIINSTSHDWQDIAIDAGNVEHTFTITNDGTENLVLSDVVTSCMCTTAQLILGDETSPIFGMHSNSSYTLSIPPGNSAELKAVFDPAAHGPDAIGPISRQISLNTNDQSKPEITLTLAANVTR